MKNNEIAEHQPGQGLQSLDDFLDRLEAGPSTFGWDALLVFDRGATNTLLSQEYIDRLVVQDVFFPALPDDTVDAGSNIEHVLRGLVLDKPRLSFENATIQESRAKVQMRLVGGQHLEVHERYLDGQPVRQVASLSVYNAANGGVLDMTIRLEATSGTVEESGKVLLDLKNGFDHVFSGGGTSTERIRLGLYFDQVLKRWSQQDERITQFPLSEIVVDATSPINPGVFGLRTHAAPGATVRASRNYGDGAVVVFVAMVGSEKGTYPADDAAMTYMLPEAASPYTSNLLLSHAFMMRQLLDSGFNQVEWLKNRFELVEMAGRKYKLVATQSSDTLAGEFEYADGNHETGPHPWQWSFRFSGLKFSPFSERDEVVLEDRAFTLSWHGTSDMGLLTHYIETEGASGGRTYYIPVASETSLEARYAFTLSAADGQKVLKLTLEAFEANAEVVFDDSDIRHPDARSRIGNLKKTLSDKVESELRTYIDSLKNMTFEIDALRLNKLLFRGDNVVEPRDVSLPTDLTLLGNLAPKHTELVISPLEPIVASGQILEFEATPALSGITWAVENLEGETGETGQFKDASVGRYTAPSDEALRMDGHRRLIVTATRGEQVAKALVSVVPSLVSVNPWVATVSLGKSHALTAGTPDAAALAWDEPELGTVGPDYDALNPTGYKYTAPTRLPELEPDDPVHYLALRLVPITVRPVTGGAQATIDMLVLGPKNPNYWLEPSIGDDGSVALPFYRLSRGGGKVEVPEPVEWSVLRGSGSVDSATRVYTPAPDATDQYVIISAFYDDGNSVDTHDYVILPMPSVTVRQKVKLTPPTDEV